MPGRLQSSALNLQPNWSLSTSTWSPKPSGRRMSAGSSGPSSDQWTTQIESAVDVSETRAP